VRTAPFDIALGHKRASSEAGGGWWRLVAAGGGLNVSELLSEFIYHPATMVEYTLMMKRKKTTIQRESVSLPPID